MPATLYNLVSNPVFASSNVNDGPQEVGPRFELRLFQIKLGTMDMNDAENEYVLRPYMNTAKKRKML